MYNSVHVIVKKYKMGGKMIFQWFWELCSLAKMLHLLAKSFAFSHKSIMFPWETFPLLTKALKYSFSSHLILIPSQKFCKQTQRFLGERKGSESGCKRTEIQFCIRYAQFMGVFIFLFCITILNGSVKKLLIFAFYVSKLNNGVAQICVLRIPI